MKMAKIVENKMIIICLFLVFGVFSGLPKIGFAQDQTKWHTLPPFDSYTGPAVSGHYDGQVYVVGVAFGGLVAYTSADSPGGWANWQIIGPQPTDTINDPAFYADPDTPPVLLRDGNILYLFARGKDDNLYETSKNAGSAWAPWHQLTTDRRIMGRISVAITDTTPASPFAPVQAYCHILYRSVNDTVEYRRFFIGTSPWQESGTTEQVNNALEGTLGSDGKSQILAAVRTTNEKLLILKKLHPWNASWKTVLSLTAEGPLGGYKDISNIVYLGGEFHLVYAVKYLAGDITPFYAYHLEHLHLSPGQNESFNFIASYDPQTLAGEEHPKASLALYRNKLVLAYTDALGWVRAARWDNIDPARPWFGGDIVDPSRKTSYRPALGWLDRRPFLFGADYGASNFGNDLFAALTEVGTNSLHVVNYSRAILVQDVNSQFSSYDSHSDTLDPVCRAQNDPLAPTLISDIGLDGKPFFTELGFILWAMPDWMLGSYFKNAGTIGCQEGNLSGRFDPQPTCNETKYPAIIITQGRSGLCSGAWMHRADPYSWNIFHELMHAYQGGMGFTDDPQPAPGALNETRTGIPLSALTSGFTLFRTNLNSDCADNSATDTCPDTRAPGFTGYGNNYDASTRQHSFIGALYYYFYDGDQFRQWIKDDIGAGDTLLQQKYAWIKQYIFKGVEFRGENDPLPPRLPLPVGFQDFIYEPTPLMRKSPIPSESWPIGVGTVAEGGTLFSLEVGTLEFEAPVDIYLALFVPEIDPVNIYLIRPNRVIQPLAAGLVPWEANVTGPIDTTFYGDILAAWLPPATYYLGMLVTPAGNLLSHYFWVTSFVVD
jgi:hypothetical protein